MYNCRIHPHPTPIVMLCLKLHLTPGIITSFAVHTEKLVCNTAKLGIEPGDKTMNLAICVDFRTIFSAKLCLMAKLLLRLYNKL